MSLCFALLFAAVSWAGSAATAQIRYELSPGGEFEEVSRPEPGSAGAVIAEARRLLAEDKPGRARTALNTWIKRNRVTDNRSLPQAYLLLGDAKRLAGDEYAALYDYESIVRRFPESPEFPVAVEREVAIAIDYINGKNRKILGLRIQGAEGVGEELLIRAQERLPGSALAERAAIELADYYYRERRLELASDMYEIFVTNHPASEYVQRARLRQIFANVARFKGPLYDASGLIEARALIEGYIAEYPREAYRDGIGEGLVARIDESQAAAMLATARWYLRRDDVVSTRFMLRRLLRQQPRTSAAQTALALLRENGWIEAGEIPEAVLRGEASISGGGGDGDGESDGAGDPGRGGAGADG